MKYMAKDTRMYWDIDEKPIQKQSQQTLFAEELCSNMCLNNCALSENTLSHTSIISKGFYQTEAQKAIQNAEIDKAFEVAEQ